jgi:hypothetical protein
MKAILILIALSIAWFVLSGVLGVRRDGLGRVKQTIFERITGGLAIMNKWGTYAFWAAIGGGIVYAIAAVLYY